MFFFQYDNGDQKGAQNKEVFQTQYTDLAPVIYRLKKKVAFYGFVRTDKAMGHKNQDEGKKPAGIQIFEIQFLFQVDFGFVLKINNNLGVLELFSLF